MSNNKVVGLVEKVNFQKEAKWTKVAFLIKGEWYSGFVDEIKSPDDRSKVTEGDQVDLEYLINGRWKNIVSVKITSKALAPVKNVTTAVKAASGSGEEWVPQVLRDVRQTAGYARSAAIEFVDLALRHEALALPKASNKRADVLLEHVFYYTDIFASKVLNTSTDSFKKEVEPVKKEEETDDLSE